MPWEERVGEAQPLVDHLFGAQHYRWGYGKTKSLGGLAVHDHLELGRKPQFISSFAKATSVAEFGAQAV